MGEDQARVLRRALRKTLREEERFLSRKEERPAWKEAVEGKVPEQLRATLNLAFQKAFRLVFLQGSGLIVAEEILAGPQHAPGEGVLEEAVHHHLPEYQCGGQG